MLILLRVLEYYGNLLQEHILTGKSQCPQNSSISLFGIALACLDLLTEVALLSGLGTLGTVLRPGLFTEGTTGCTSVSSRSGKSPLGIGGFISESLTGFTGMLCPGPRFLVIFRLHLTSPVGVDIIYDLGPGARPTTFPSTLRSGSQALSPGDSSSASLVALWRQS